MKQSYKYFNYCKEKSYGSNPYFIELNALGVGFSSLYAVTEADAKAIEQAGTAAGFRGTVYNTHLWLDVDTYEQADIVERRLREMELAFVAFDSGGKGAHFGINRSNDEQPSHLLPAKDKAFVKLMFPEADTSIYTHLHPFRLPGTVHEKTGRKKELITQAAGLLLLLPELGREDLYTPSEPSNLGAISVFDCYKVMANTTPEYNGRRHEKLVRLAYALKQEAGVQQEYAHWWLMQTNLMFEEPKSEEEISNIIRHVFGGAI